MWMYYLFLWKYHPCSVHVLNDQVNAKRHQKRQKWMNTDHQYATMFTGFILVPVQWNGRMYREDKNVVKDDYLGFSLVWSKNQKEWECNKSINCNEHHWKKGGEKDWSVFFWKRTTGYWWNLELVHFQRRWFFYKA